MMEKASRKPTKIIKKSMQICQVHLERVPQGRKIYPKGIDLSIPRAQVAGPNSHFSDFLAFVLAFILRVVCGKASRSIFLWILIDFWMAFGNFFGILSAVHRTSGNVILIHYLLCLRHITVMGNMQKM